MKKHLFHMAFILVSAQSFANIQPSQEVRDQALAQMQNFAKMPGAYLPNFTDTPRETGLSDSSLKDEALKKQETQEIYAQAATRHKEKANFEAPEIKNTEALLQNPQRELGEHCLKDNCNYSLEEYSNDAGEGISRLGMVGGAAAASIGADAAKESIFPGVVVKCSTLGTNKCCGALWEMTHCSDEEKGRVVPLWPHHNKYYNCVFASRLAAIIQIQGRNGQLGISFGPHKHANCRGITTEELTRIDFSRLDLSSIQQDFLARVATPKIPQVESRARTASDNLYNRGQPHA